MRSSTMCKYYLKGYCTQGNTCKYQHVRNSTLCKFFNNGNCSRGQLCSYRHMDKRNLLCDNIYEHNCPENQTCRYKHYNVNAHRYMDKRNILCDNIYEHDCTENQTCRYKHYNVNAHQTYGLPKIKLHAKIPVFVSHWRYRTDEDYQSSIYTSDNGIIFYNNLGDVNMLFRSLDRGVRHEALKIVLFVQEYHKHFEFYKSLYLLKSLSGILDDIIAYIWITYKKYINSDFLNCGFKMIETYMFSPV